MITYNNRAPDTDLPDENIGTVKDENSNDNSSSRNPFFILFDILMTGTTGWRRLRKARLTPEQTAAGCLYPMAALAAVIRFSDWFYAPEFVLSQTLISAVSIFISFFFSYFAVQVVCRWLFPAEMRSRTEIPYFRQLTQYALASLALFWIPAEIFPPIEPITVFLPIWTAFIITKGMHYLRIPKVYANRCTASLVIATVAMPYLIMFLCDKIL